MRALLITKEGVKEVTVDGSGASLDSMYRHMDCQTVTSAGEPDQAHVCYADDEGMFKLDWGGQVTTVSWYPEKLVGKLLVTGFDSKTGETIPATMNVDDLRSMVKVGELRYE